MLGNTGNRVALLDKRLIGEDRPHVVVFPGAAIMLAVLGFNRPADGLRDIADPRLR